jgi:hypothetical protein
VRRRVRGGWSAYPATAGVGSTLSQSGAEGKGDFPISATLPTQYLALGRLLGHALRFIATLGLAGCCSMGVIRLPDHRKPLDGTPHLPSSSEASPVPRGGERNSGC